MWAIRSKKNNTYYKRKIDSELVHFVVNIKEARLMKKKKAIEVINNIGSLEKYELIEIRKKGE